MDKRIIAHSLSTKEAEERLIKYGRNELTETRRLTLLKSFFSQFDNFLTILLVGAGVVSYLIGERIDRIFIFLIVMLNALFGVYQEFKAEKALSSLKQMTTSSVRVIRDGTEKEVDSRLLVPGDMIYLEEGSIIPADGRVFRSWYLEVNEASLTGESLPVAKSDNRKETDKLWMGTIVARGRAYAQVIQTGTRTKFGQIGQTLATIEEVKTPLQKKLEIFTRQIGVIGILASLTVFVLSFIQDKNLFASFIFAVSLAVAAVPEGLPAVMTITLAIGTERMAKKKAIVRKLNSIETLGSVTLVATDKTGTLTTNQMSVKKIWVAGKTYDISQPPRLTNDAFHKLVLNGIVCSTASLVAKAGSGRPDVIGDATEGALLLMAQAVGLESEKVREEWPIADERAFDPVTKRMSVVVRQNQDRIIFSKGAPESILSISTHILNGHHIHPLDARQKRQIETHFQQFAAKGLRMIAFSYQKVKGAEWEKNHIFLGFVGIADPIRPEIKEAVMRARQAGIKVVMITGDNELTAKTIGLEAGIIRQGEDILNGQQLDAYTDEELLPIMGKVKIFARTSPEHKHRLVKLFQKKKEVVAVTGDGVNDALALKQADVGVAMGITGTDVAKETAHMIITDDNFATLINAIEQGRNIFNHIKNAVKYLLACNIGEVLYILVAVILQLPIFTPLQLLYINLITDGLPAVSLAFSPDDRQIMQAQPRRIMAILQKNDYKYIFMVGIFTAILALVAIFPWKAHEPAVANTILFTTAILIQHFVLVDLWLSRRPLRTHYRLLNQPIFLLAFFFPLILHAFIIYSPFMERVFSTTGLKPFPLIYMILVTLLIFVPLELSKIKTFFLSRLKKW